jgi:hypothetical protein
MYTLASEEVFGMAIYGNVGCRFSPKSVGSFANERVVGRVLASLVILT